MIKYPLLFILPIILQVSCGSSEDPINGGSDLLPELSVRDAQVIEQAGSVSLLFELKLSEPSTEEISVNFTVKGLTAEPGIDFIDNSGRISLPAGSLSSEILVPILDDNLKEMDEKVSVTLSNVSSASITDGEAIGVIVDNDISSNFITDGYITNKEQYGYNIAWEDEFDGELDPATYNYELGDNGWGNNELQNYTNSELNSYTSDGKLIIKAINEGGKYTSARITTQGKKEFKYGRIDIRAKLPIGQGIWPALWMLGANIGNIGWPACGEIDIMENIGRLPKISYGTAHWGPQGRGFSTYKTGEYSIPENFNNAFHVFSIVWEFNRITWYVDETKFFTIGTGDMQGEQYRFNENFFFILNVAVGGNWPGNPDETTVFPQQMEIDYIRVFQ